MLVCNKSLDDLSSLAKKYFGQYKYNENPEFYPLQPSFTENNLGKIIWLLGQKNKNLLSLIFPISKELIDKFQIMKPNNNK